MSFQSMPHDVPDYPQVERCGKRYYEFDGREGRVTCKCSRPKGHLGYHGYGEIHELRRAAQRQDENTVGGGQIEWPDGDEVGHPTC